MKREGSCEAIGRPRLPTSGFRTLPFAMRRRGVSTPAPIDQVVTDPDDGTPAGWRRHARTTASVSQLGD